MSMQPEKVEALIRAGFPDAIVRVEGDGAHFTALVVSAQFAGKSRIAKQQLVYATVQRELADGSLHALSLRTFTPDEWAASEAQ